MGDDGLQVITLFPASHLEHSIIYLPKRLPESNRGTAALSNYGAFHSIICNKTETLSLCLDHKLSSLSSLSSSHTFVKLYLFTVSGDLQDLMRYPNYC